MKKLIAIFFTSILLLFNIFPAVKAQSTPPTVSADSVVLMDATTGKILYEKNKNSAYPPASTTKIMTALLVLENANLEDVVTVSKNAEMADGSKIYIFEGEQISVKELLYGLILASANDCAVALAEHISGSTEEFSKLMNERAKSLGCENTNFVNPNGLYDVNHKTSAYDLALIMQEVSKREDYKEISTTSSYKMAATNKTTEKRPLWNGNKLIQKNDEYYYEGCEGGKTGYTVQSQHSYVSVATRNGQKLIVTLIHDSVKTFFSDSRKLFDYGFNNFELSKFLDKDDAICDITLGDGTVIPLLASQDFYFVKAKGSTLTPTVTPTINTVEATSDISSVKKGDILSKAIITCGEDTYNLDLSSGVDYTKKSISRGNLFSGDTPTESKSTFILMKVIQCFVTILILFLILMRIRAIRRRSKAKRAIKDFNNRNQY